MATSDTSKKVGAPSRTYKSVYSIFQQIQQGVIDNDINKVSEYDQLSNGTRWHNKYMEEIISKVISNTEFHLHVDNKPIGPKVSTKILERIVNRFCFFDNKFARDAFRLHMSGMYSTANGILTEFSSNLPNKKIADGGVRRGVFEMKKLNLIPCWKSWTFIYSEGKSKMKEGRLKPDKFYPYIFNSDCRGLFQVTIIHLTGLIGVLCNDFHRNISSGSPKHPADVIKDSTCTSMDDRIATLQTQFNVDTINYFREHIWIPVIDDVLQLANNIYETWIMTLPFEKRERFGRVTPGRIHSHDKLYVNDMNYNGWIKAKELVGWLLEVKPVALEFWAKMSSHVFRIFLTKGHGLYTEITGTTFDSKYKPALENFYRIIHQLLLTTIYDNQDSFGSNESERKQFIAQLQDGRTTWIASVIARVKENPIRFLETHMLRNIIRSEKQSITETIIYQPQQSIPTTSRSNNTSEIDQSEIFQLDATAADYERIQATRTEAKTTNNTNVTILVVENPPDGSLDEAGKCHCCRLDWKKLNGRVQIMRCPPGSNDDTINKLLADTLEAANNSLQSPTEQSQPSENRTIQQSNQIAQLTVPSGQTGNQQLTVDVSAVNQLNPITIVESIRPRLTGRIDRNAVLNVFPDLVQRLYDQVLQQTSRKRRRSSFLPLEDLTTATDNPQEVTVSLSQLEDNGNDNQNPPSRRMRLDIKKNYARPVIPDEVVEDVINQAGLGEVNTSNNQAFSTVQSLQDQADLNIQHSHNLEDYRHIPYSNTQEDDHPANIISIYEVDEMDASNESQFNMHTLLFSWIKEKRFQHHNLINPEEWKQRYIAVNHGPLLSPQYPQHHRYISALSFPTIRDFIGSYETLTAFELYHQIYDVLHENSVWNRTPTVDTDAVRYNGDEQKHGITTMKVDIPINIHQTDHLTAYSLVVIHTSTNRHVEDRGNSHRALKLFPYERRLALITDISFKQDHNHDKYDTVSCIVICQAQFSQEEYYEHEYCKRQRDFPPMYASIILAGYVGPTMRYSDVQTAIRTRPPALLNIFMNRKTNQNQYKRIMPFSTVSKPAPTTINSYIQQHCTCKFRQEYFQLLFSLTKTTIPVEDLARKHLYLQPGNSPTIPMPAQITSIITACEIIDENYLNLKDKKLNSPIFTIVGPAGTGKTTTVMSTINAALNRQDVAEGIINMYDHIEYVKSGEHTSKPKTGILYKPEDRFRVLIVTETNNALEEIENQLMTGMFFSSGKDSMRHVIPLYTKVAKRRTERHHGNSQNYEPQQQYVVPEYFQTMTTGTMTLSTFGSIRKAFKDGQFSNYRHRNNLPQFNLVVMDESSQIGVRSFLQVAIPSIPPNSVRSPTFLVAGDGCQQKPITQGKRSAYSQLAQTSILEMLIPSTNNLQNSSNCPWVQLDVQFRMNPTISELSNAVSGRAVATHESVMYQSPPYISSTNSYFIIENIEPSRNGYGPIPHGLHKFPLLWVDPYASTVPMRQVVRPSRIPRLNCSFVEVATTVNLVSMYVTTKEFKEEQILILTPYNEQFSLIKTALRQSGLENVEARTIGSIQGNEKDCVIISTVRNSHDRHGGLGIVGDLNTVYVAITRPRFKLVFIGNYNHLKKFEVWRDLIQYFDECRTDHISIE